MGIRGSSIRLVTHVGSLCTWKMCLGGPSRDRSGHHNDHHNHHHNHHHVASDDKALGGHQSWGKQLKLKLVQLELDKGRGEGGSEWHHAPVRDLREKDAPPRVGRYSGWRIGFQLCSTLGKSRDLSPQVWHLQR